jgi:gliding motility-associated-like protein
LAPSDTVLLQQTSCDPSLAGIDTLVLQNSFGCDSLVITATIFDPTAGADTTFLSAQTCDPALAGIDTVFLQNSLGCDSLVVVETVLAEPDIVVLVMFSCNPLQVGIDTMFLQNSAGCDSLVITQTLFNSTAADTTLLTLQTCDPVEVGIETQLLQNSFGCDSLVITETVLALSDTILIETTTCDPALAGIETVLLQNSFGCDSLVITETVLVPSDTILIQATTCDPGLAGIDTLFLQNSFGCDSLVITETVLSPSDTILIETTTCDPALAGIETVLLQNSFGCDSLIITETVLLPSDAVFLTAETCDPALAGIDTVLLQNSFGCDSLVITETVLLPSDTVLLTAETCDLAAAGIDTVLLQNSFGCDSLVITETFLLAADTGFVTLQLCAGETIEVAGTVFDESNTSGVVIVAGGSATGCDSVIVVELAFFPPAVALLDTTLCSGDFILVNGQRYDAANPSGTELIAGGSSNGCDSTIQISLSFAEPIAGFIEGGETICLGQTAELTLRLTGATAFNVELSDGSLLSNVSDGARVEVAPSATTTYAIVSLEAIGSPCPVDIGAGVTIEVSDLAAQAQATTDFSGFGVSCADSADGAVAALAQGGVPPLAYAWNTGATGPSIANLPAGSYTVTVTDGVGCAVEAQALVSAPPPITAQVNGRAPTCFDEGSGSIWVEELSGGTAPYEYSLDGQFFQSLGNLPFTIENLAVGNYPLILQDVNDCQLEVSIVVPPTVPLFVDLGLDRSLKLGDSIQLVPQANFTIEGFTWSPVAGLSDPNALEPFASPTVSTTYTLNARDADGCSATAQIAITVDKRRSVYIPNAFSPNGDGNNDYFTVYAGADVREVKLFRIFDRWGNLVFEAGPLRPNEPTLGWDGSFRGEPLGPAVFVFYAEVEFVDGVTEMIKGDVLLLR